jgi:hypothetical protein
MGITLANKPAAKLHAMVNTLIVGRLPFGNRLARIMHSSKAEALVSAIVGKTFG